MTLTVSLSHLPKVEAYLAAKKAELDIAETRDEMRALKVSLVKLRARHVKADARYARASEELAKLRAARKGEFEEAKTKFHVLVLPDPIAGWIEVLARSEADPMNPRYHPDRAAAYTEYQRTQAASNAVPYSPDKTARDAIAAEIKTVEQRATTLYREVDRIESALEKAAENLPDYLLSVDDVTSASSPHCQSMTLRFRLSPSIRYPSGRASSATRSSMSAAVTRVTSACMSRSARCRSLSTSTTRFGTICATASRSSIRDGCMEQYRSSTPITASIASPRG